MEIEMLVKKNIVFIALLATSSVSASEEALVKSCADFVSTTPGVGVAYRNHTVNDDYNMSIVIPKGETGWGGVADNAPFHGFTIFPSGTRSSCIIVLVGWRVDEDEKPIRAPGSIEVNVRGTQAWSEHSEGMVGRRKMVNESVSFSAPVRSTFADGQVIMVASADEMPKVFKVYRQILDSLSFRRKSP